VQRQRYLRHCRIHHNRVSSLILANTITMAPKLTRGRGNHPRGLKQLFNYILHYRM
ncbi:hypothetical protein TorRG33x02_100830, partial [Trema orientale]